MVVNRRVHRAVPLPQNTGWHFYYTWENFTLCSDKAWANNLMVNNNVIIIRTTVFGPLFVEAYT